MREGWPGFEGADTVRDHVTRQLPRDYPIFARMEPGDDYPRAHEIAEEIFQAEVHRRLADMEVAEGGKEWQSLRRKIVPPYDPSKFPNKWGKLDGAAPARTLLAHLGHDSYTHIHHDNEQARTITVREAARLQSFPDGFVFYEAMNPAFRMIGNAVPPLMAFRLAERLLRELREAVQRRWMLAS
jgi:DNA (cytosine-5)-methyltransferase 1